MATDEERPVGFGRLKRKEDPRFIRGQGTLRRRRQAARACCTGPCCAARSRTRGSSRSTPPPRSQHPKVHAVITGKDLEALGLAWMPTLSADTQAVLATDKVRFQGQEVAFVVADDRYAARDALELIDVDYEPLPAVVDARKALDPDAPVIRDDKEGKTDNHIFDWEAGDQAETEAVFANADVVVVTQDMLYPRVHPAPLETCGCGRRHGPGRRAAQPLVHDTQAPHAHRTLYALVAGLPGAQDPGDLAGHRRRLRQQGAGSIPATSARSSRSIVTGKPVKWMEDRTENLMSTGVRPRLHHARRDRGHQATGKILGMRVDVLADHGAFNATAQPTKYPAGFFHIFTGSYDLEAAHCTVKGVYTNKAPGGVAYRCSFRVTEAAYLVERMVDVLADELGDGPGRAAAGELHPPRAVPVQDQDRLGLRLRRLRRPRCARRCEIAGYDELRAEQQREARARRADGHRRLVLHRDGRRRAAQAHGHPRARHGRRRRAARAPDRQGGAAASACQSQGQGHETTFAQIVAEELGIPPEDIEVVHGDTDRTPFGLGTYGCRSTPVSGAATAVVARKVREQGAAGRRRRCSRPRPTTSSGRTAAGSSRATPRRGKTIQEIAMAAHGALELPEGVEGALDAETRLQPAEPDVPVRRLHLRRGRRPGHRPGQGAALRRRRRLRRADQPDDRRGPDPRRAGRGRRHRADGADRRSTRRATASAARSWTTSIPTAMEVPDWELGETVTPSPHHPIGAKGVGESATVGSPPAIVNAVDRRAAAVRRAPHRHAVHAGARVGRDAGPGGAAAVMQPETARRADALAAEREPVRGRDGRARAAARRACGRATRRSCSPTGRSRASSAALCAEASVRLQALRVLETGEPLLLRIVPERPARPPTRRALVVAHNPCLSGGALEIFLEPRLPPPRVVVVGDTPIARALADLGERLGLRRGAEAPARRGQAGGRRARRGLARPRARRRRCAAALEAGVPVRRAGRQPEARRGGGRRAARRSAWRPTARAPAHARRAGHRRADAGGDRAVDPGRDRRERGASHVTPAALVRSRDRSRLRHERVGQRTPRRTSSMRDETVYFCCDGCRAAFEADPADMPQPAVASSSRASCWPRAGRAGSGGPSSCCPTAAARC